MISSKQLNYGSLNFTESALHETRIPRSPKSLESTFHGAHILQPGNETLKKRSYTSHTFRPRLHGVQILRSLRTRSSRNPDLIEPRFHTAQVSRISPGFLSTELTAGFHRLVWFKFKTKNLLRNFYKNKSLIIYS